MQLAYPNKAGRNPEICQNDGEMDMPPRFDARLTRLLHDLHD